MLPDIDLVDSKNIRWLILKNSDLISQHIRKYGHWGLNEISICSLFIEQTPGATVLDVGANLGGFTIPIAKKLSETAGKIISFEPQRIIYQQLCANSFINRLDNVYAYNFALGDKLEKIFIPELNVSESGNTGAFSIDETIRANLQSELPSNQKNVVLNESVLIEKRTLDSMSMPENIGFIKVDIEGYELEFFKGATETIQKCCYPPIFTELWDHADWCKEKSEETLKLLRKWGYEITTLGAEILAQHPSYKHRMDVQLNETDFKISMRKA